MEPTSGSNTERQTEDEDVGLNLFHHIKCDEVSANTCIRLGNKARGTRCKAKTNQISPCIGESQGKNFVPCKNLKGNTEKEGVLIHQDLIPKQYKG
jgi:hypothetical protein